jgi:hypothetical protein
MSKLHELTKYWAYPDRSSDRQQLTLRVPYDIYAKLHALKRVYQRPVNDMITDILAAGLDEIIESLPSRKMTYEEAQDIALHIDVPIEEVQGSLTGPRIEFDSEYKRLLEMIDEPDSLKDSDKSDKSDKGE